MKNLIIIGNDKIGAMALAQLPNNNKFTVYIDRSTNIKRVVKLILKGRISFLLAAKLFFCEFMRTGKKPALSLPSIKNNKELKSAIQEQDPDQVILFRAGLIVNSEILSHGVRILNIHCASLPDYGGMGSISRALASKAYDQMATLHIVTTRIDEGEVVQTMPYRMNPSSPYCKNEMIAYKVGISLLQEYLNDS